MNDDTGAAYGFFRDLMIDLGIPIFCLPGNHDVRDAMQKCLAEPPFHYCDSFEKANWLLVCLDSCVSGEAAGRLADAEFERLERLMQSSSEDHVMICLHHPVVETGSAWLDSVGLENNNEVLERLAAYERARLCIFGHVHQSIETVHSGLRIFATPSTCGQFAPLSEEFSLADKPPAYRRFELRADGSIDQQLIWVDYPHVAS